MDKLNILILATGYYPAKTYGGPVSSIQNLAMLLKDDCRFYVVTRNHELHDSKKLEGIRDGWCTRDECEIIYLDDSKMNVRGIVEASRASRVDFSVVFSQSFFDYCLNFAGRKISKELDIPFLIAPRGEICPGAFNFKRWKKVPYTALWKRLYDRGRTYYFVTSDEEHGEVVSRLGASEDRIFEMSNVPSIGSGRDRAAPKKQGHVKLIYLSRIHPKKNLRFGIEMLVRSGIDAELDVYGPLEDKDYWNACLEAAGDSSSLSVEYKGLVDHEKVIDTFSDYDAFLFPTLSENYGHVIAESLSAGCPVIISDQTPWTPVNENGAGWAMALDDEDGYISVMRRLATMTNDEWNSLSCAARAYADRVTDFEGLRRCYLDMFERMVGNL